MSDAASQSADGTFDFREIEIGPWRVVVREDLGDAFASLSRAVDFATQRDACALGTICEDLSGRGRNAIVELPGVSERFHLRPLRHGGFFAPITGDRFADLERPLAELRLSAELARRDAPIAAPAFVVGRRAGMFWQAAFASVHVDGARDGVAFLDSQPEPQELELAAVAAATAIRKLHDLGCCHADLHIKNLLIDDSHPQRVTIIDLDRAKLASEVSAGRRMQELMRLRRSLLKRGYTDALSAPITRTFMDAYLDSDVTLRDHMLARGQVERLRGRAHAMFYRAP